MNDLTPDPHGRRSIGNRAICPFCESHYPFGAEVLIPATMQDEITIVAATNNVGRDTFVRVRIYRTKRGEGPGGLPVIDWQHPCSGITR